MASIHAVEETYKRADRALDRNEPKEAARLLRELAEADPDEPLFHWRLGYALSQAHDYELAIKELKRAIELDPVNVPALGCLGVTYLEMGDWELAENAFRRRLELKQSPQQYVFLARALMNMHRDREAAVACLHALRLDPSFAEAFLHLGLALRQKDPNVALMAFMIAARLDHNGSAPTRELGLLLFAQHDAAVAKDVLAKATAMDPRDPWGHLYLAVVLEHLGQDDLAESEFREAISLDPDNAFFQEQFAQCEKDLSPADETRESRPLRVNADALRHILGTVSGRKLLEAAARFAPEEEFGRNDLAKVLEVDEPTVSAWLRQLGRPEKKFGITVFQRHGSGMYSISEEMRRTISGLLQEAR